MRFLYVIRDNVITAIVVSVIIALVVLVWERATDGGLISLLQGVTKSELAEKLKQIQDPSALNKRMTLECTWEPVGHPRSTEKDVKDWCPRNYLIRQFYLDEKSSTHVADALCCKLVFSDQARAESN